MKRLVPVLLVCTFLLYLFGVQFIYWLKVENARQIAHSFINKKDLKATPKVFSLTIDQYNALSWNEKDKEFSLNGQDYDVIRINHLTDSKIEVECYADNLETEITIAFKDIASTLFASDHQKGDNKETDLLSKITKEYIPIHLNNNPVLFYNAISFLSKKDALPLPCKSLSVWRPPCNC